MLDLIQITGDAAMARRCDALEGMRLFVDLERLGKAQRQAGRDTFISAHTLDDVARIRDAARRSPVMVRINPLHDGTAAEVEAVLARGADRLMLPMFATPQELQAVCALVAGRVPVTALLETPGALDSVAAWAGTPGLDEVYVGLNDLHLALGLRFMFEPLATGLVDRAAAAAHGAGRRFGFGGIARAHEGLLPGREVLAEHLRLGSRAVILSRTFHRADDPDGYEREIAALRAAEAALATRGPEAVAADRARIGGRIAAIAAGLPRPA
jgi:citrate lyase beta subunit